MLDESGIPRLFRRRECSTKESADSFIFQIKEQAKTETGWVKIRDLIVLPYIIYGGLWLIEQTIIKTVEETKKV